MGRPGKRGRSREAFPSSHRPPRAYYFLIISIFIQILLLPDLGETVDAGEFNQKNLGRFY